jgi:hypothetical protein
MKDEKCYYCDNKAEYNQPEKETGIIIGVCFKHFTYIYAG